MMKFDNCCLVTYLSHVSFLQSGWHRFSLSNPRQLPQTALSSLPLPPPRFTILPSPNTTPSCGSNSSDSPPTDLSFVTLTSRLSGDMHEQWRGSACKADMRLIENLISAPPPSPAHGVQSSREANDHTMSTVSMAILKSLNGIIMLLTKSYKR